MNHGVELARIDRFGNIYKTPCGIVSINISGVTLHLTEDAFLFFSSMVGKASSLLIDRGLADLTKETET